MTEYSFSCLVIITVAYVTFGHVSFTRQKFSPQMHMAQEPVPKTGARKCCGFMVSVSAVCVVGLTSHGGHILMPLPTP